MHPKRRQGGGMNGGGQHRHHNRPRRFNNNRGGDMGGGDTANVARTRRNALQQREKYQMMARDALSMGDRVLSENYLQHADHYHRILLALPPEEPRHFHQQQPGFNQQGQPQQEGGDQRPQDGGEAMPSTAASLPPFITQPGGAEMPEE